MVKAALHVHTKEGSDGEWEFGLIVERAIKEGYKVLAITDHDNILNNKLIDGYNAFMSRFEDRSEHIVGGSNGVYELHNTTGKLMDIVSSCEFSSHKDGCEIHILGFFLEQPDEAVKKYLEAVRDYRMQRNKRMVENLQEQGMLIKWGQVKSVAGEDAAHSRYHIGLALDYFRITPECPNARAAMDKWVGESTSVYEPFDPNSVRPAAYVIQKILDIGGIPIWAHPRRSKMKDLESTLAEFKKAGLMGVEINTTPEEIPEELRENLLFTAGTDFHGDKYKPNSHLGKDVPEEMLARLYGAAGLKLSL